MTTIQDRRCEAENTIRRLTAQREGCIANLIRYEGRLILARRKLERIKRASIKALERDAAERAAKPVEAKAKPSDVTDIPFSEFPIADLDIPPFLKREPKPKKADAEVAAEIAAANKARKTAKSRGRIAKMKAKQAGELRRMPLTGNAALAFIQNAMQKNSTK